MHRYIIKVSDQINSLTVRVNNAENCLPDICANRRLNLFNKDLSVFSFFFRDTQINQMWHLQMVGNLKNQTMNSDLILMMQKTRMEKITSGPW